MTFQSLEPLQKRIGHFPIELPAAALLATAAAVVTLALPAWRFESLVAATGLSGVISAAQPPLGQTARVIAAAILSVASFLAAFYGLRALDRGSAETDFPAFRAADLHPDAPRRRPILAEAEFGAPAQDLPPIDQQLRRRKIAVSEPLPSFLAPQPPTIGDFVPATATRAPDAGTSYATDPLPVEDHTPPSFMQPLDEPEAQTALAPEAFDDFMEEPGTAKAGFETQTPSPRPVEPATPMKIEARRPPIADDASEESVGSLMARLEGGLSRRVSKPQPTGPGRTARDELERALGDLDRVAGAGDKG